jgi:hypothetical protein
MHAYLTMDMDIQDGGICNDFVWNEGYYLLVQKSDKENL